MERKLALFPNSVLTSEAQLVPEEEIPSEPFQKLIEDMIETALRRNALGLAAPQIGVPLRLFVVRKDKLSDEFDVFINPNIILKKDRVTHHGERCLSVPESSFDVKRFKSVTLDALDRTGKARLMKSRNKIQAFAFQHEMDHLDGILVKDKGVERN
jgi:peptide deformylase